MPKRPVTTRDEMIEGAFRLIRRKGLSALTARSLAEEIGCSTQPIMYQFPNLKELKDLAYERADRFHTDYITKEDDLLEIGMRYIRFASEEKELFRFLFQSGHFDGDSITGLTHGSVTDAIIKAAAKDLEIPEDEVPDRFEVLFAIVHGYASLIANNALEYDEESLREKLIMTAEGLMR